MKLLHLLLKYLLTVVRIKLATNVTKKVKIWVKINFKYVHFFDEI